MRTFSTLLFLSLIIRVNTFAQINKTNIRTEFFYANEDKEYEWFIKRELTAKLYDKIDVITNDSVSYIELKFTDEVKNSNYGYIYLSNQQELNAFIIDLTAAIDSISRNNYFSSPAGKYKIEVTDKTFKKKTFKTIKLFETIGGNAFICLNYEGSKKLLDWLKGIIL